MQQKEIDTEIQENIQRCTKDSDTLKREQQTVESNQKNLQKGCEQDLKILEELEAKHPYIAQIEQDIDNFDKSTACKQLEILQNERDWQPKRVNKNVSSTLSDHEKRYEALIKEREIVLEDKLKLHEMIVDLIEKNRSVLKIRGRKLIHVWEKFTQCYFLELRPS